MDNIEMSDRKTCNFNGCPSDDINGTNTSRVDVKATIQSSLTKHKPKIQVSWKSSGEAIFHRECWDKLITAARKRNTKTAAVPLIDSEKKMIKEAAKTAEFFDSREIIDREAEHIAQLIKTSSHCVAFTGAGISTSAGIGDYRGKSGKWTEEDRATVATSSSESCNESSSKRQKLDEGADEAEEDGVPYEDLRPTYTHEALYKLIQVGLVKHIISQNGDGLHVLSGVQGESLSELHGNVFQEVCEKCGEKYNRAFYVMDDLSSQYYEELEDNGSTDVKLPSYAVQCDRCGLSHRTGRKCNKKGCKGYLRDTIINFRDLLDIDTFSSAEEQASLCDLMLCLGTTITVTPASDLVEEADTLVICNRQKTHKDKDCVDKEGKCRGSRVFGDCDVVMAAVMKHILPPDELESWEGQRHQRMEQYNEKRKVK